MPVHTLCLVCTVCPLLLQQTVEVALTEAGKDLKALKDAVGVHIRTHVHLHYIRMYVRMYVFVES